MFLSKEKILTDDEFGRKLAKFILNNSNINTFPELYSRFVAHSDKEDDDAFHLTLVEKIQQNLDIGKIHQELFDVMFKKVDFEKMYQAIYEDISKKVLDNLPAILSDSIQKLISSEEGVKAIGESYSKLEAIILEAKKKSKAPWINVTGDIWDEENGRLKIALEWNDSFIALLRKQGIVGENEDDLVEEWLRGLANQ